MPGAPARAAAPIRDAGRRDDGSLRRLPRPSIHPWPWPPRDRRNADPLLLPDPAPLRAQPERPPRRALIFTFNPAADGDAYAETPAPPGHRANAWLADSEAEGRQVNALRWIVGATLVVALGIPRAAPTCRPGHRSRRRARGCERRRRRGEPVLEPPTLHSLACYWIVSGDANRDARVEIACSREGRGAWRKARPLPGGARGAPARGAGACSTCRRTPGSSPAASAPARAGHPL